MAKYTAEDRRNLADKGHALPDGSFPIADVEDLKSSIRNWALGKQPTVAKRHIIKRARAIGSMNVIPSKWFVQSVAHANTHSEVDEFLEHFGVKGMHWGQRKDTASESKGVSVKKYLTTGADLGTKARVSGISDAQYKALTTKAVVIKKGTEFHRITNDPDYLTPGQRTYVAYTPEDVSRYTAMIPYHLKQTLGKHAVTKMYDVSYTAAKDIVSPSEKERVDAYIKILDQKVDTRTVGFFKNKHQEDVLGRDIIYDMWDVPISGKQIRDLPAAELGKKTYRNYALYQNQDHPTNTAYFNEIKKRGYNALVDDNDVGRYTDNPMVLLDREGTTNNVKNRLLSKKEIKDAGRNITAAKSRGGK